MRQGHQNNQNNRRGRSRTGGGSGGGHVSSGSSSSSAGSGNRKGGHNPLTRSFESNGPDVKIRGTAMQIADKYLNLARDAMSSGDLVMSENYLQHAEHYNRIIMSAQTPAPNEAGGGQPMRPRRSEFDQSGNDGSMQDGDDGGDNRQDRQDDEPANELPSFLQPPHTQARFQEQPRVNGNEGRGEGRFRERQSFDRERPERGPDRPGQDRFRQDRDRSQQDRQGQDRQGQDRQGQDRQGQDRQGQDRQGQDRQGQDRQVQDRQLPERQVQDRQGQDRGFEPRMQAADGGEPFVDDVRPISVERPDASAGEVVERDRSPRRRRRPESAGGAVAERRLPRRDSEPVEGEAVVERRDHNVEASQFDTAANSGDDVPGGNAD